MTCHLRTFFFSLALLAGCAATPEPAPPVDPVSEELRYAVAAFNNRDYPAALSLFEVIVQQPGHRDWVAANKALGVMYTRGLGVEPDHGVGTRYIRRAAEGGDAESQAEMARRYDFGVGVERDPQQILHWAGLAAAQGNPQGQQYMGWAHHFGIGVEENLETAVSYYQAAAAGGDPIAQNNLAVLYQKGQGVPQDLAYALSLFESSARQGFTAAQIQLGLLYFQGQQVPRDPELARHWLQQAAGNGSALGAYFYGQLLESEQAIQAAREQYRQAAAGGVEQAVTALQRLEASAP